jgi:hypothetical protein
VLDRLIDEGVTVDLKRGSYDFGRFGRVTDLGEIMSSFCSPSQLVDAEPVQISSEKPN